MQTTAKNLTPGMMLAMNVHEGRDGKKIPSAFEKVTSVTLNPRGCKGNVHVEIQNGNQTKCYWGGAEVFTR